MNGAVFVKIKICLPYRKVAGEYEGYRSGDNGKQARGKEGKQRGRIVPNVNPLLDTTSLLFAISDLHYGGRILFGSRLIT
ncbi:hypothetical protein E2C01_055922 [Portunus trituberculatus]|uniref:Uncharacterized protein n=1 Tax=Portunus trituberculatus TaxID=210409 RepID=A0A5B7GWU7_PORTR|nr:hypothetical protein [Portunus trituberculatus]